MSALNQVRALSRIRRAITEAQSEIVESEREFLEAGGVLPTETEHAIRVLHARIRVVNGLVAAHAKELLDDYDDQKTPARTPSAMLRAATPEAIQAFENASEIMRGKKAPGSTG